jgi:hypothetical protein
VLRSFLLRREGKKLEHCFTDHEGMWEARVALDLAPSGKVEGLEYLYLGAADFTHQDVLRECLDPILRAARLPPVEKEGRVEIGLKKDDMVARPLHLELPKMNPVAMQELFDKTHAGRLAACFSAHPGVEYVDLNVRLDADGKVVSWDRSGYSGREVEEWTACAKDALAGMTFPKSRAGGWFSVDVRRPAAAGADAPPAGRGTTSVTIETRPKIE